MKNTQSPAGLPAEKTRRSRNWLLLAVAFAGLLLFVLFVHPFLAINRKVQADTLVVEGWLPDYAAAFAAKEFQSGHYSRIFVSGLYLEKDDPHFTDGSDSAVIVRTLRANGVDAALIEACPIESPSFNRTSAMARAVSERMKTSNYVPHGVNVVTLGPHARQTLVAYERMLGARTPVGVISYPKDDYDPTRWWASVAGIQKTTKDFVGWLKEILVGLRS
jgi:hypothetical protein